LAGKTSPFRGGKKRKGEGQAWKAETKDETSGQFIGSKGTTGDVTIQGGRIAGHQKKTSASEMAPCRKPSSAQSKRVKGGRGGCEKLAKPVNEER